MKTLLLTLLIGLNPGFASAQGPGPDEFAAMASREAKAGNHDLSIYYYRQALLQRPGQKAWQAKIAQALLERGKHGGARRLPPPPLRSEDPMPAAVAAWASGDPQRVAARVNAHNQSVSKAQQILYLFYPGGEISFSGAKASLAYNFRPCLELAERLVNDVRVLPILRGRGRHAVQVGEESWAAAAAELGAALESDRRLGGLMLSLSPASPASMALFGFLKNHSKKITATELGSWSPEHFKYSDLVVLKLFDLSGDPKTYTGMARSTARAFMRDARREKAKVMIGLPASAGNFQEGLDAVEAAIEVDDPSFHSPALWAVHEEPGAAGIPGDLWQRLKIPLLDKR